MIEMLVVIGIIGILASLLMPSLARAKAKANQIDCLNNMRQLALSLHMYGEDYNGEYPMRRTPPNAWPHKLKPYFVNWKVLACRSDRFGIGGFFADDNNPNRSYIINGFNDFFKLKLAPTNYALFRSWKYEHGMREADIPKPSETIIFGEKKSGSPHVHMDLDQGRLGNDIQEIDHVRHGNRANFAFVDGSVRLMGKGEELYPYNLWTVVEEFRNTPAPPIIP